MEDLQARGLGTAVFGRGHGPKKYLGPGKKHVCFNEKGGK